MTKAQREQVEALLSIAGVSFARVAHLTGVSVGEVKKIWNQIQQRGEKNGH